MGIQDLDHLHTDLSDGTELLLQSQGEELQLISKVDEEVYVRGPFNKCCNSTLFHAWKLMISNFLDRWTFQGPRIEILKF